MNLVCTWVHSIIILPIGSPKRHPRSEPWPNRWKCATMTTPRAYVLAFSLPSEYRVNVAITTRFSYVESGTNIAQYLSVFHGHIFTVPSSFADCKIDSLTSIICSLQRSHTRILTPLNHARHINQHPIRQTRILLYHCLRRTK